MNDNSKKENKKIIALGIDLGTSNSAACAYIDGKPIMITSDGMDSVGKMLPSYVAFINEQIVVGVAAKNQYLINPNNTIYESKRKMGSNHTYNISGKSYRPEQIAAYLLKKIKNDAEKQLNAQIKEVVVTVPAQFSDN